MRAERTDRRSWKSRVTGLEEFGPPQATNSFPQRPRRRPDDDDAEYRLAIEASKAQEEEDKRKRESRQDGDPDDEDLRKALQLSKEEEEARRKELERTTIFDDGDLIDTNAPSQPQPQFTGFGNQGYQQGNPVDFFANPIDGSQMQGQPTGYMANAYTGFQPQATGYPQYANGYGMGAMQTGMDPYGQQQQQQQQQQQPFQPQPTGYNPYLQVQQQQQPQFQVQSPPAQQEAPVQPGSNNPWATNNQQQSLQPTPTGSNNPFATSFGRPQTSMSPGPSNLGSLPEQKTLSTFNSFNQTSSPQPQHLQPPQQQQSLQPIGAQQREVSEHEHRLNTLLAGGDGQDTFGNTGQLRIPAQHTAPGTFVNSAGSGVNRLAPDATGSNPFMRAQFTGMPSVTYGQAPAATGPAGVNGNPFSGNKQGQGGGDLIQL